MPDIPCHQYTTYAHVTEIMRLDYIDKPADHSSKSVVQRKQNRPLQDLNPLDFTKALRGGTGNAATSSANTGCGAADVTHVTTAQGGQGNLKGQSLWVADQRNATTGKRTGDWAPLGSINPLRTKTVKQQQPHTPLNWPKYDGA